LASFLRLSPLAVCAVAGAIVANLPGGWREETRTVLARLERPIYYLFLTIAGALWHPFEWQGGVLLVLFVAARWGGKWLGVSLLGRTQLGEQLSVAERRTLAVAPLGALSVAIIVNAQDLYSGRAVSWMVTAVIGGAIVTEIILQGLWRGPLLRRQRAEAPKISNSEIQLGPVPEQEPVPPAPAGDSAAREDP
jgi:hypothetical protein